MRSIACLLLFAIFTINFMNAEDTDYQKLWKEVHKTDLKRLPESGMEALKPILTKARKDGNQLQLVKALIYQTKYMDQTEDDSEQKTIELLTTELETTKAPATNLIHFLIADQLKRHYQRNRWRILDRTPITATESGADFQTWDVATYAKEINRHLNSSLDNPSYLKAIPIKAWEEILQEAEGSKTFRPTLYDFLAHHALDAYSNDEYQISNPKQVFEISDPRMFARPASTFDLTASGSDRKVQALLLLDQLIAFHQNDPTKEALIDVTMRKLEYVRKNGVFENKSALYLSALESLEKEHKGTSASTPVSLEIAKWYYENGTKFQAGLDTPANLSQQFGKQKALELCNALSSEFPKSQAGQDALRLARTIQQPSLQIQAEGYVPINTWSRVRVSYQNLDLLRFSLAKASRKQFLEFQEKRTQNDKNVFVQKLPVVETWTTTLKNEGDFQLHTTEVKIPKLSAGYHVIIATDENGNKPSYQFVQASSLAIIDHSESGKKYIQVADRAKGEPAVKAQINISKKSRYKGDPAVDETIYTNQAGIAVFNSNDNLYDLNLKVSHNGQDVYFDRLNHTGRVRNNDRKVKQIRVHQFTDRAIYRPGQKIYFKAIMTYQEGESSQLLTGEKIDVVLFDINQQEVARLPLTTNDFGSVQGEFQLPDSGPLGLYNIRVEMRNPHERNFYPTSHSIRVEEYKRPKFQVEMNEVKGALKLNEQVSVDGFAKSYSGAFVSEADVTYRVFREAIVPYWYYWRRPNFQASPAQEITNGTTKTDDAGKFIITFDAVPDLQLEAASLPVFKYRVDVDVTDINGETRTTSMQVSVGYHSLATQVLSDTDWLVDSKGKEIQLTAQNLNGTDLKINSTLSISKLVAPERPVRKSIWSAVDYNPWEKAEFKQYFPNDPYEGEDDLNQWKKGRTYFEKQVTIDGKAKVAISQMSNWPTGAYEILLSSKDENGSDVVNRKRIFVRHKNDKLVVDQKIIDVKTDKSSYNSGEQVTMKIGSAVKGMIVNIQVDRSGQKLQKYQLVMDGGFQEITIPVNSSDLGGMAVHYDYIFANSYEKGNVNISVPYPKKDLEIETVTFRDHISPGGKEKWQFKVKGAKGEKVAAEMLASMYDQSLDQFVGHRWNFNPTQHRYFYSRFQRGGFHSFKLVGFLNSRSSQGGFSKVRQQYDQLNWFGKYGGKYLSQLAERYEVMDSQTKKRIKAGNIVGMIRDIDGEPLVGVTIHKRGTKDGTVTDAKGVFSINAVTGDRLMISYVGYSDQEIRVNLDNFWNITMIPASASMEKVMVRGMSSTKRMKKSSGRRGAPQELSEVVMESEMMAMEAPMADGAMMDEKESLEQETAGNIDNEEAPNEQDFGGIQARTNFNETAFFFPQLLTDKEGNVTFEFDAPDALTTWKMQLMAHDKDLNFAITELSTISQKELMITPNAPRFLRHGDQITISSKLSNLTKKLMNGSAQLTLVDAVSGESIDAKLLTSKQVVDFQLSPNGNSSVFWNLTIPEGVDAVQYKIVAKAGAFSDGEQSILPVLSNRMLVTETMPIWVRDGYKNKFTFDKLANHKSSTLKHHQLTFELTTNPAWYAIKALPYLVEYQYDCSEQTFAKYYGNALAHHIVMSNPKIKQVFDQWEAEGQLVSNLEKNQELKSILIEETPWLRSAQDESEQQKRIAELFKVSKTAKEQKLLLKKLAGLQMGNGGFPWFKGSRYANRYITQHIVAGFGHLKQLEVGDNSNDIDMIVDRALSYLDGEMLKDFDRMLRALEEKYPKKKRADLLIIAANEGQHLNPIQVHYLYTRTFFSGRKLDKALTPVVEFYRAQATKYWPKFSLSQRAMLALVFDRSGQSALAKDMLTSIKEHAITDDEMGMFWKGNVSSWYWHQAPIETQALLIEAFAEVMDDMESVEAMKVWLLKKKQTEQWSNTKATTEAIYALLHQGTDWLAIDGDVQVSMGGKRMDIYPQSAEAGSGYIKTRYDAEEVKPELGEIKIKKSGAGVAWGAMYWQYFEDLDKVTFAETPLSIQKGLFVRKYTDAGETMTALADAEALKVGDLVRVRVEIRSDRDMEFVHLKDMRASGLEPVNVLSQYKYQGGLGYYESTKDASTNFFFERLPKGTYVFEYDLRVNNAGEFSNGITTIQCMYAPEFTSHSAGERVFVAQ